ncbi:porin [Penaeicola halotolerans]|uniref:porin n=1 Tax=Penaeicola halotolerans TaxID=2793196 RepID=UPI001CF8F0E4|nr:porin [Penaeicola halotolerans]
MKKLLLIVLFGTICGQVLGQNAEQNSALGSSVKTPWFESIQYRGYAQLRYNRLFETNPDLSCDQCDRSWGENGGFFFRRIRMIFYGDIHPRVYFYIQPDFASGGNNFAQIRDAYFDLAIDAKKRFRVRIGQSKVPFGFENLQSSQNRIPLDRNDGLNSAVANERDIGLMFYYAPEKIRRRFSQLVSSGLKGSGDYGVFGLGIYNGQTANQPERNSTPHIVMRATYPFELPSGQIIEGSLQGYTGEFVINRNTTDPLAQTEFREYRYGASFVLYPQPFGIQAEYNFGRGPEFDTETLNVEDKPLQGGYIMTSYYIKKGGDTFIPFARWHYYAGGKKHELDATKHRVNEQEIGVEWQPHKNFELVAMYTFSDRTFENSLNLDNRQKGSLLRLQAQVNF